MGWGKEKMKTLLCKKTVCVLAVFVVLAVLAVGAFLWSASAPAQSGEAVPAQQPVNQNNILTNDKIQLITSNEPYSLKGAGTTEGYYYIETNSDTMMSANIRYIDYATCQDISLSSNLVEEQNSEANESFLSSTIGGSVIMTSGDQVYVVCFGVPELYDEYKEDSRPRIVRMDKNGANREIFYRGADGERLLSVWAADGAYLYGVAECTKDTGGQASTTSKVVRISKQEKTIEYLGELPENTNLIAAFGRNLVFHQIAVQDGADGSADAWENKILCYSVDEKSYCVIKEWKQKENLNAYVYEDTLVTVNTDECWLAVQDIAAGQEKIRVDLSSQMALPNNSDDPAPIKTYPLWFDSCIDGRFVFADVASEEGFFYAVDLKSGECRRVALSYYDEEKGSNYPMEIVAKSDTAYLVVTGKKSSPVAAQGKDGTIAESTRLQTQYGIITKENYWNGKAEFRTVERSDAF